MARRMTFEGFLGRYVQELAGERTTSLRRLAAAERRCHRVRYPLVLWAALTGRLTRLRSLAGPGSALDREVALFLSPEGQEALHAVGRDGLAGLGEGYAKAWDSWVVARDAVARDRRHKELVRLRTRAAMESSDLTAYRLARESGLDTGNLYAFLAGDSNRLSLADARRVRDLAVAGPAGTTTMRPEGGAHA